MSKLFT